MKRFFYLATLFLMSESVIAQDSINTASKGKLLYHFTNTDMINLPDSEMLPVDSLSSSTKKLADTISFAMVGDIMMGTTYPTNRLPADDGAHIFEKVSDIIKKADIGLGNMEGVMCEGGTCTKGGGANSYAFRMPTSYAHLLTEAGFDFLSLANNHSNDFGPDGIKSTMKMLDEQNIAYAGVVGLCEKAIVEKNGVRYGFCAFGHNKHVYKHQDTATVRRIITSLRDSVDILIVSMHGGAEGKKMNHVPHDTEIFLGEDRGNLRQFTHFCIDLGADFVFGHGPHVVRGMELYKGHFIAYSLGNFCTPYGISLSGISGYAPVVTIRIKSDGTFIDGQIHSFIQQSGMGPQPDTENKVAKEIKMLTEADFKDSAISISNEGKIEKK